MKVWRERGGGVLALQINKLQKLNVVKKKKTIAIIP